MVTRDIELHFTLLLTQCSLDCVRAPWIIVRQDGESSPTFILIVKTAYTNRFRSFEGGSTKLHDILQSFFVQPVCPVHRESRHLVVTERFVLAIPRPPVFDDGTNRGG